mmetsp:Transcript_33195/g.84174  ORF Transcript_33195/g.84174 Transcript_33195/m.84174 type:complete len:100 (+) Transcript_33195:1-300(+)
MEGEDYGFPVDVYSCGMLLFELVSGLVPFTTSRERLSNEAALVLAVSMGERPALDASLPSGTIGQDLRAMIESSWSSQPGQRPTAGALAEHLRSMLMAM